MLRPVALVDRRVADVAVHLAAVLRRQVAAGPLRGAVLVRVAHQQRVERLVGELRVGRLTYSEDPYAPAAAATEGW